MEGFASEFTTYCSTCPLQLLFLSPELARWERVSANVLAEGWLHALLCICQLVT